MKKKKPVQSKKKAKEITKLEKLKAYLKTYRWISSLQGYYFWGYTRMADGIWKLRKAGWNIETVIRHGKDRYGNDIRYATYRLKRKRRTKKSTK